MTNNRYKWSAAEFAQVICDDKWKSRTLYRLKAEYVGKSNSIAYFINPINPQNNLQ